MNTQSQIQALEKEWRENPRWKGITRPYSAEEVLKLRGKYKLDYTIATQMSELLWKKLNNQDFVAGLGALTGKSGSSRSGCRFRSDLSFWLASCRRRESFWRNVS